MIITYHYYPPKRSWNSCEWWLLIAYAASVMQGISELIEYHGYRMAMTFESNVFPTLVQSIQLMGSCLDMKSYPPEESVCFFWGPECIKETHFDQELLKTIEHHAFWTESCWIINVEFLWLVLQYAILATYGLVQRWWPHEATRQLAVPPARLRPPGAVPSHRRGRKTPRLSWSEMAHVPGGQVAAAGFLRRQLRTMEIHVKKSDRVHNRILFRTVLNIIFFMGIFIQWYIWVYI